MLNDILGEPRFNFLILEDDREAVSNYGLFIRRITDENRFRKKFGNKDIAMHFSNTPLEAQAVLEKIVQEDPNSATIMVVNDAIVPHDTVNFIDEARSTFSDYKLGAVFYSKNPNNNSKMRGVYRLISYPVKMEEMREACEQIIRTVFYKEMPKKSSLPYPLHLKVIDSLDELVQYFRLRYAVHGPAGMGYIPNERFNPSQLDIDAYDPRSIHIGGFIEIDGQRCLVTTSRITTPLVQELFDSWIRQIISYHNEYGLMASATAQPRHHFPTEQVYDFQDLYRKYTCQKFSEMGRLSVLDSVPNPLDPDNEISLRGLGLSRFTKEFGVAVALQEGYPLSVGSCIPGHAEMYAKYGYVRIKIDPARLRTKDARVVNGYEIFNDNVATPAVVIYADFRKLPQPSAENVSRLLDKFRFGNYSLRVEPGEQFEPSKPVELATH